MKIIAFAASNSLKSINRKLVTYASTLSDQIEVIKLTDYNAPIYSPDIEEKEGIPDSIKKLTEKLATANAYIISLAEYNGNFTPFFKNIFDWLTRYNREFLKGKKVILYSTSPGANGASSVMAIASGMFPYFDAKLVFKESFGSFNDYYKDGKVVSEYVNQQLQKSIESLE